MATKLMKFILTEVQRKTLETWLDVQSSFRPLDEFTVTFNITPTGVTAKAYAGSLDRLFEQGISEGEVCDLHQTEERDTKQIPITTIQRVYVDMYEGYSNAVYETLSGVAVIVDRFHVAKNYRGCADKARKQEMHALKKTLSDKEYAELKGVMWIFRKRWADLTEEQRGPLLMLFRYSPMLQQVYIFREVMTSIFNRPLTKAQAVTELEAWIQKIQELGLNCFDSFVGTLRKWMDEITHYFIQRQSSGFVEGLNNKIKVIKRRCYGIYDLGRLFQHIWIDVEGRRLFGYA